MGRPSTLAIRVTSDSRQAQTDMQATESSVNGTLGKLKTAGPAVAAAAAAAIGAAIIAGISTALEQGKIKAKLGAQLGATPAEAQRLGKLAGSLYTKGITEDFQTAADTISAVMRSGLAPPGATTAQLEQIATKAGDLANVFGQDVTQAARAASQMVKTGLAKNSNEAFDILTRGFQTGANSADDLLDTFSEYSTQFRDMGIDGKTAMGLIQQGLAGGARDADLVADAFKELNIRVKDKSGAEAIKALGLNADTMARQFAQGGPAAAASLDTLLDKLRAVKDPAERTALSVQLLGTQSEDLAQALLSLDPSTAVAGLGNVAGAADKVGSAMRDNAGAEIQAFQRVAQQKLVDFIGGSVIPVLRDMYRWWNDNIAPVLRKIVDIYLAYLGPVLAAMRDGIKRVTDKVKENQDKWEPLARFLKDKVAPLFGSVVAKAIGKTFDILVWVIDKIAILVGWLKTLIGWLKQVRELFNSIKAPSWVGTITDTIGLTSGAASRSSASGAQAFAATQEATATQTGRSAMALSISRPMAVHVTIDGQQLQGRITRTVNSAMNYDGSRYLAGGWA